MCPPNGKETSNKINDIKNNEVKNNNTNATTTTSTPQTSSQSSTEISSVVVQTWSNIYNSAPKLYIPFTKFDIAFSVLSCIVISTLRLINEYIYTEIYGFSPNTYKTIESAACTTSIAHAIVLCHGLWALLRSQPYVPSAKIENTPAAYQSAVTALLQLCTGYMLYDTIFMIRSNQWSLHEDDVAYLGHHIVTILYMSQTRILGVGHISAMALMFTGEITNPFQNTHMVTKYCIQLAQKGSLFHIVHPYAELAFATSYFFARGIVGPIQIAHITYDLLLTKRGRSNVPLLVGTLWSLMIWGIILGSIPWTRECYEMMIDGLAVRYDVNTDYGPRYLEL